MASNEDTQTQVSDFYDFNGLEHFVSPFLAKENTLAQCLNFVSTGVVGGKTTRPPYGLFLNSIGTSIRNLIYFVYFDTSGNSNGYLIAISGNNFYTYLIGSTQTEWELQSGFTCTNTTQPFGYTVLANVLHLSNGTDVYQTWDPTDGFIQYPEAPMPRWLVSYQNRVHGGNTPGAVGRDYFSSVDFTGAPGENSYITQGYSAGATSIQINDAIFLGGNNQNLSTNNPSSTGMHWIGVLGEGGSDSENIIVTGITATVSGNDVTGPYTLTLQSGLVNNHSQYDVIINNDPWYSDNNNASSSNYFDPNNIGAIIQGDVVNNNLVLHKSSGGIYLYNGNTISNPLQANNPAFNAPGQASVSPYAIDQINGNEFFLNHDGVYIYTGGYPTNISYSVYDFIQNMDPSQYQKAPGIAFNQKYYLAIGTVTDNLGYTIPNCILVYDYILNLWETCSFDTLPTTWCVVVDNSGQQQLLFGDSTGQVYQYNIGIANNSQPANAILETHYLTWGAPEKTKEWQSYVINTNPGANFQLQTAVDWSNKWTTITTISGFGISDNAPVSMKNFKSIAFRIISNTTVPMTFYGLNIKLFVGSRRNSGRRI
jgi:hypothetical protein